MDKVLTQFSYTDYSILSIQGEISRQQFCNQLITSNNFNQISESPNQVDLNLQRINSEELKNRGIQEHDLRNQKDDKNQISPFNLKGLSINLTKMVVFLKDIFQQNSNTLHKFHPKENILDKVSVKLDEQESIQIIPINEVRNEIDKNTLEQMIKKNQDQSQKLDILDRERKPRKVQTEEKKQKNLNKLKEEKQEKKKRNLENKGHKGKKNKHIKEKPKKRIESKSKSNINQKISFNKDRLPYVQTKFSMLPPELWKKAEKQRSRSRDLDKRDIKKSSVSSSKQSMSSSGNKSGYRFASPPKFSDINKTLDLDKHYCVGSYDSLLPTDPLKDSVAALEALRQVNPMVQIDAKSTIQKQPTDAKADRKLYVGNLPPKTSKLELQDFMNQQLNDMNVNKHPPGPSIVSTWLNSDGHFGFLEFRTPQEASQGFCLNQIQYNGHPLKIGRPNSLVKQIQNTLVAKWWTLQAQGIQQLLIQKII